MLFQAIKTFECRDERMEFSDGTTYKLINTTIFHNSSDWPNSALKLSLVLIPLP